MDFNFISNNLKEMLKINTPAEPSAHQGVDGEAAGTSSLSDQVNSQQANEDETNHVTNDGKTADVADVLAGGDNNHVVASANNKQIVDLSSHSDGSFIHLLNRDIVIIASPQTETIESKGSGSSKIKNTTVTRFDWERKYQMGSLLSLTNKYFSYAITGLKGICVRVMKKDNSARLLLKGMTNSIADMSFYDPKSSLLAIVDSDCNFFVFCIHDDGDATKYDLILHVKPPALPSSNHRINWIANPDLNKMDLSDDMALLRNPDLYPPVLLVLTYGTYAEIWNLNAAVCIRDATGTSVFARDELKAAFTTIDNEEVLVSDCELSPNGSVLALSGFDGHVKFWQVDPLTETETDPEELHCWKPHGDVQVSALKFLDNSSNDTEVFWRFVMTGCNKNRELKIWCTVTWNCLQTIRFESSSPSCETPPELKVAVSPTSEFLLVSDIQRNVLYAFRTVLNTEQEYAAFVTLSYYQLTAPIISLDFISIKQHNGKNKNKKSKSTRLMPSIWNGDSDDCEGDVDVVLVSSGDEDSHTDDVASGSDDDSSSSGGSSGYDDDDVTEHHHGGGGGATTSSTGSASGANKEHSLNFLAIQPRALSTMEATFISPQTRPANPLDASLKSKDVEETDTHVQSAAYMNTTGDSHHSADDTTCQQEENDVVVASGEPAAAAAVVEVEDNEAAAEDANPNTTWPQSPPPAATGGSEPDLTRPPTTPTPQSPPQQPPPVLLTPDAFMFATTSSSSLADVTAAAAAADDDVNQSSLTKITSLVATLSSSSDCSPEKASPLKKTMKNPLQDASIDSSIVDLPSTSHCEATEHEKLSSLATKTSQSIIDMLANAQKEASDQQQRPSTAASAEVRPMPQQQYFQRIPRSPDIISSTSTVDGGNETPQQPPQPTPSPFGPSAANHPPAANHGNQQHQSAPQQSTQVTSPKSSWSIAPDVTMPLMSSSSSSSSSMLLNKNVGAFVRNPPCVKVAPNSISYQSLPSRGHQIEASTSTTPSSNSYQSSSSTSRSKGASNSRQQEREQQQEERRRQEQERQQRDLQQRQQREQQEEEERQQQEQQQQQQSNNEQQQQQNEQVSRLESLTSETRRNLEELETARSSLQTDMKNMEALFKQGVENINRLYADAQNKINIIHAQQTDQIARMLHGFNERHNQIFMQHSKQFHELHCMNNAVKQMVEEQTKRMREITQQNLICEANRNAMMDTFAKEINFKLIPKSVKGFEGILNDVKDNMLRRVQEHDRSIQMHINNLCSSPETVKRIVDGVTREMMDQSTSRIPELMQKCMIEPIENLSKNLYMNFAEVYHSGLDQLVTDADKKFQQKIQNEQTSMTKTVADIQVMSDQLKSVRTKDYCHADEMLSNTIVSRMGQFMEAIVPRITAAVTEAVEKSLEAEVKQTASNGSDDADGNNGKSIVQLQDRIRDLVIADDLNEAFRVALHASDLNIVVYLCGMLDPQTMYNPCPLTQPILLSLIQQLATDLTSDLELKIKFLQMSMMSLDPKHHVTSGYLEGVIANLHKRLVDTQMSRAGLKEDVSLHRDIAMLSMACKSFLH